jgi:hypothetical protein
MRRPGQTYHYDYPGRQPPQHDRYEPPRRRLDIAQGGPRPQEQAKPNGAEKPGNEVAKSEPAEEEKKKQPPSADETAALVSQVESLLQELAVFEKK